MNMVLNFPVKTVRLGTHLVQTPNTGSDYLKICKKVLTQDDYEDVLLSIMDREIYEKVEDHIKRIVDCFYEF